MEATAAAHNDNLLCLDEIGTCDVRDIRKVIYDLFGGTGKARLNKNSEAQQKRSWRIVGLSTGELSIAEKISEEPRHTTKAGLKVRLLDIAIDDNVIMDSHGASPSSFVNSLKEHCGQFYGSAGPIFIEQLIALETTPTELSARVKKSVNEWENNLSESINLESYQKRGIRRLALILVAGLLARDFGILPFEKAELVLAIKHIRDAWLNDVLNIPEDIKGLLAIRNFIIRYRESRFLNIHSHHKAGTVIRDLAGYIKIHNNQDFYLFTDAGFLEACGGCSSKIAITALKKLGCLHTDDPNRAKSRHMISSLDKRLRLYAIKGEILEWDGNA